MYGVCRGMQFIAEYFGSTFKKISNHVANNHILKPTELFWGSEYLKKMNTVNSYHNYSIHLLGKNLLSVATAEDSTIEAFIHKSYKIFGQMWHPEREDPFRDSDKGLIQNFFDD